MATIPGYYTISEAAKVIGVSDAQCTRYCQQKLLKTAINVGKQWLIKREEVANFERPPMGNPAFRRQKRA